MSWQCDECDQAHFEPRYSVVQLPPTLPWWRVLGYVAEVWLIYSLCEYSEISPASKT